MNASSRSRPVRHRAISRALTFSIGALCLVLTVGTALSLIFDLAMMSAAVLFMQAGLFGTVAPIVPHRRLSEILNSLVRWPADRVRELDELAERNH